MKLNIHKDPSFIIIIFLVFATLGVYWQVQDHDFVGFDDDLQIYENSNVQMGLTIEGIVWAFTTTGNGHWMPLTWLSYLMDFSIYGLNPGGYHLTSLLFHIANTVLLFLVLKGLTGTLWRSAFASALFALHPLHVEPVAWVSARRDVLSTLFWILTMWAYVRYVKCPGTGRYFIIFLFLVLGLMSKAMLVTLPFVLLLLDYWPLSRMVCNDHGLRYNVIRLIREKVPFFALVAASSVATIFVGYVAKPTELFTLKERIANSLFSYVSYIGKMVWPQHLAVFYPFDSSIPVWNYTGAGLLMVCISALVFWRARKDPYLLVGWLWYLGTLVPVVGFVQANKFSMADRYTYVPLVGLFIIAAWGVPDILARLRYQRIVLSVSGGIVILILMLLTWFQVQHWCNSTTLFKHTINVTTKNYLAHNNLGLALDAQEKYGEAIVHYCEAIKINPGNSKIHYNLGNILLRQGKHDKAIFHYKEALRINPSNSKVYYNLGNTLLQQGKHDKAIFHYKEALRINPDYADAHNNLGVVLCKVEKLDEAIFHYKEALQINPDYAEVCYNLGNAILRQGRRNEAIFHYEKSLQINPYYVEAHNKLGSILAEQGKYNRAIVHFSEILRVNPAYVDAHYNIGVAFELQGHIEEAIMEYRKALRLRPDLLEALDNLAWIFATHKNPKFRNGEEAVKLAEKACELTSYKQPLRLDTLAAAYAEAKQFEEALHIAKKAKDMANANGQVELAKGIEKRMHLYKAGQPFYENSLSTNP